MTSTPQAQTPAAADAAVFGAYASLVPLPRRILELLAVNGSPLSLRQIADALRALSAEKGRQKWETDGLDAALGPLLAQGLATLCGAPHRRFACDARLRDALYIYLIEDGQAASIRQALRNPRPPDRHGWLDAGQPIGFDDGDMQCHAFRDFRWTLFEGDVQDITEASHRFNAVVGGWRASEHEKEGMGFAAEAVAWLRRRRPSMIDVLADNALLASRYALASPWHDPVWLRRRLADPRTGFDPAGVSRDLAARHLFEWYALRGDTDASAEVVEAPGLGHPVRLLLGAITALLQGRTAEALAAFEDAFAARVGEGTAQPGKPDLGDCLGNQLWFFALMATRGEGSLDRARALLKAAGAKNASHAPDTLPRLWHRELAEFLVQVAAEGLADARTLRRVQTSLERAMYAPPLVALTACLSVYWASPEMAAVQIYPLIETAESLERMGLVYAARQAVELARRFADEGEPAPRNLQALDARLPRSPHPPLADLMRPPEKWRTDLASFRAAVEATTGQAGHHPGEPAEIVAWHLNLQAPRDGGASLQLDYIWPQIRKRSRRAGWTHGRSADPLHIAEGRQDAATAQDRMAASALAGQAPGMSGYQTTANRQAAALACLAGHPHVYMNGELHAAVEVECATPVLVRSRHGRETRVAFRPLLATSGAGAVHVEQLGARRLRVTTYSPEQLRLAASLGSDGIRLPPEAEPELEPLLSALHAIVPIESDGEIGGAEPVAADPVPHVRMTPWREGIHVEIVAVPVPGGRRAVEPGSGAAVIVETVGGTLRQARRDLAGEAAQARALLSHCPSLADGRWAWDLETALAAVAFLGELSDFEGPRVIEWPQGEAFSLTRKVGAGDFTATVASGIDWFAVDGRLRVDDATVLSLMDLLARMRDAPAGYIALDDRRFLRLDAHFRRRLQALAAIGRRRKDGIEAPALAVPALRELLDGAEVAGDAPWQEAVRRFEAAAGHCPRVPATLTAELRPYQEEGFRWLSRLAAWGAGACLADDMGLGKTVQALAVILERCAGGPTLVVAPTSVCFNWKDEMRRFAPTLAPHVVHDLENREAEILALGPFDVLLCSYTLLHQHGDTLSKVAWATAVLDEAQAIKNPVTRRAEAAFALNAGFRLATTGTPVENNLTEFWSLFSFLNPGLLGSRASFVERFATPLERGGDDDAWHALRRLVTPFVLRRTKTQVLDELPERTEIVRHVELVPAERDFYEALRRQALAAVAEASATERFEVLAQLTRLRRACCHPSLAGAPPEVGAGSKQEAFLATVDELLAGGHRALVFSQFVDHLTLLRGALDGKGIGYQYLDGATPFAQREQRVREFQAGTGSLFLISLKAGGTGLNLTAADYVLHMDPWWNPAVEDQASDRAHRIGQTRPVTVYRFVARGTIEEKIVELHARKRHLADRLLDGTDTAGKLSVEELVALLRDEA